MLVCALLTVGPGPVRAWAQDNPTVSVHLDQLSPSSVSGSGDLTLNGTVTNDTDTVIPSATVKLWRDKRPITNLDAMQLTLTGATTDAQSEVTSDGASAVVGPLPAHGSRSFTVHASFTSGSDPLDLLSPRTANALGVTVSEPGGSTLGSSRFLMPYPTSQGYRATTVAELASTPSLIGSSSGIALFADDHLSQELASGGRLDLIASVAEQTGATAVIDPLLWDELQDMVSGYQVRQADGTEKPGTAGAAAAGYLARLGAIAHDGRCYRAQYGLLNFAEVQASGRQDLLNASLDAVPSSHPLASLPLAVLPSQGPTSSELLSFIAQAEPDVVLTQTSDAGTIVSRTGSGESVVTVPADIGTGGPPPDPADDIVHRAGRLQSEQLLSSAQGTPAVNVVTTADEARAQLVTAQGRTLVSLEDLTEHYASSQNIIPSKNHAAAASALISAEQNARQTESFYVALTGTQSLNMQMVSLRAWSASFASEQQAADYLAAATRNATNSIGGGRVTVHISSQLVVPTEATQLPISLTNTMKLPVRVRVHFTSDNPRRITIADTSIITIDPGDSATVRISPVAAGNGTVQMTAVAMTTGDQPVALDQPVTFVVTANSAGKVGWMIIIAAGIVLLGATALRVKQVRREKARGNQPPGNTPPGNDSPAQDSSGGDSPASDS
ncbi:DUF6049 family protein [Propionibacterium sp.]|uniref:DUF6049 family protein n=1 Tax=Propionibacterium sp. TaxID=1977903 RepID=UPI0039EC64C4